jgi:hypothetical protein
MAIQKDVEDSFRADVADVPGARLVIETGGKHRKAIVTLADGRSRYYVFQGTKACRRAQKNTTTGFRRMLRQLVAEQ